MMREDIRFVFPAGPDDKRVLLVEANSCHAEVLPGLAKHLVDLGHTVCVLVNNADSANVFYRFEGDMVKVDVLGTESIGRVLRDKRVKNFKRVVIASHHVYHFVPKIPNPLPIEDFYKGFIIETLAPVCMVHDPFFIKTAYLQSSDRIISLLGASPHEKPSPPLFVNAHYFGKIKTHPKATPCVFTIVGNIAASRRNVNLIFDACDYLYKARKMDFRVFIIGAGSLEIPEKHKGHITMFGRLSWETMFNRLDESDFILAMLDPDNSAQDVYTRKASGSYNLAYGFQKPIIIHKKFTSISRFTNKNSIIYDRVDGLGSAMLKAVEMSSGDYSVMTSELAVLSEQLRTESLRNFSEVLL